MLFWQFLFTEEMFSKYYLFTSYSTVCEFYADSYYCLCNMAYVHMLFICHCGPAKAHVFESSSRGVQR